METASLVDQLSLLAVLSDATRLRLCALLAQVELSVVELTQVLELGQSKVSTHLSKLKEHGLVLDRRVGTSSYYRLNDDGMGEATRRVWDALTASTVDVTLERDLSRAARAVEARERSWPERVAGELSRHYSPGRTWESLARSMGGLVRAERVLDLGAGDAAVAEILRGDVREYVCLDRGQRLLLAAQERLRKRAGVRFVRADMHALPFPERSFDLVLALHVLAYASDPNRVIDEAARVLAPSGTLLLVTLNRHEHMDTAAQYGHVHPGFEPRSLKRRVTARGLEVCFCGVSSRERKRPYFEVVTCHARKESSR